MKLIFNFILLFFVFACSKKYDGEYSLKIKNSYFEKLLEVKIDTVNFGMLEVGEISEKSGFKEGAYYLITKSFSNIETKTELKIQGDEENLFIIIGQDCKPYFK